MDAPGKTQKEQAARLREVAAVFLKLGFTAFGGPAAHLALMEEEVVHRRKWLDRQHFLDMVSAVNFIPGPNSTEMAIHLGQLRAGTFGLIVAGICFIGPAMLVILPLAWFYVTYGTLPRVADALLGVKSCMVAIVAVALVRFFRTGIKDGFTGTVATLSLVLAAALDVLKVPQSELIVMGLAAVAGAIFYQGSDSPAAIASHWSSTRDPADRQQPGRMALLPLPVAVASGFAAQMLTVGLFFLKVGATLFGSGYVLASFLRGGIVEQHHWMNDSQLLDAIAVGQITPGPLLTAATFIGYVLGAKNFAGGVGGGIIGGVSATAAIFLPAFVLIWMLGPWLPRVRQKSWARGALDGMNAAVVALIALVTLWLAKSVAWNSSAGHLSGVGVGVMALSLPALLLTKLNPTWLIIVAGLIGMLTRQWS